MRIALVLGFLPVLLSLPLVHAQNEVERVGRWGDPLLLRFVGAESFPAGEIRRALLGHVDFLSAHHPVASLDTFLETTRYLVEAGYRNSGFRKAEVEVGLDREAGLIRVKVKEGIRYRWSELQFKGVPDPVVETLRKTWKRGEFARLVSTSLADHRKGFEYAFRTAGWFFPQFGVEVVLDDERALASLVLTVEDPGPTLVSKDIEVVGNEAISKAELISFLGLDSLTALQAGTVDALRNRLWESGRFVSHEVSVLPPLPEDDHVRVKLTLEEIEDPPPLIGELDPLRQTLLKLANWLTSMADRNEDLVVEYPGEGKFGCTAILSPQDGVLIDATLGIAGKQARYGLLFSADRIAIHSFSTGAYFELPPPRTGLLAVIDIAPTSRAERTTSGGPASAAFSLGTFTEPSAPFTLDMKVAPAALLANANSISISRQEDDDGVLVLEKDGLRITVESATGRLREFQSGDTVGRFERGAFSRARLALENAVADRERAFDPASPVASSAEFLLKELIHVAGLAWDQPRSTKEMLTALQPLLEAGVLTPLNRFLPPEGDDAFTLPIQGEGMNSLLESLARYVARALGDFLPGNSWTLWLAEELMLSTIGRGEYYSDTMGRIAESDAVGPVGLFYTAYLNEDQAPEAAIWIANKGLTRLQAAWFRTECRPLVEGDSILADCVLRFVEAVRTLSPEQVADLAGLLGEEEGDTPARVLACLRSDRAPREAALDALEVLWESGLRSWVETKLRRLAGN